MDDFENRLAGALSDVASRTDVGHAPLAEIKTPAPRRGWVNPLVAAAAVLAVVGTGFAVAPLVGGDEAEDLVVAAPGKRLAGLGSIIAEVPEEWGTTTPDSCGDEPQRSAVMYGDQHSQIIACTMEWRATHSRPESVETLRLMSASPFESGQKGVPEKRTAEVAGLEAEVWGPSCAKPDQFGDNGFCSTTVRFSDVPGAEDVWVTAEAWTPERTTEMLSWLRHDPELFGVPSPATTLWLFKGTFDNATHRYTWTNDQYLSALDAYLTILDAAGLEAKVVEDATPLTELEEPTFTVAPEPTTVLSPGDEVTVTVRGIDLPDSTPDDAPPSDTRQIGMGDLMMDVPAAWKADAIKCDVPIASTWLVGLPESRGCFAAVQRPDDVEMVRWQHMPAFADLLGEPVRREEFLGVETTRWDTECQMNAELSFCTARVWFHGDDSKALVTVEAPTAERAEELLSTLRRSDTLVGVPPAPENPDGFANPAQVTQYLADLNDLGLGDVAVGAEDGWEDADELLVTTTVRVGDNRVEPGTMVEPGTATATVDIQLG